MMKRLAVNTICFVLAVLSAPALLAVTLAVFLAVVLGLAWTGEHHWWKNVWWAVGSAFSMAIGLAGGTMILFLWIWCGYEVFNWLKSKLK